MRPAPSGRMSAPFPVVGGCPDGAGERDPEPPNSQQMRFPFVMDWARKVSAQGRSGAKNDPAASYGVLFRRAGLAPLLFPAKPQWSKRTPYNSITPQAAGNPTQRDLKFNSAVVQFCQFPRARYNERPFDCVSRHERPCTAHYSP